MQRLLLRMVGQEEIGYRIREARESRDWTQADLANAIGVATAQSISRYERGETEVPARRLRRIAEATGKPMSFFVQEPDEVVAPPDRLTAIEEELHSLNEQAAKLVDLESGLSRLPALLRELLAPTDKPE